MSRWFVSATFVICVGDFPRGKVSVKVGVMEFGLHSALNNATALSTQLSKQQSAVRHAIFTHAQTRRTWNAAVEDTAAVRSTAEP